MKHLLFLAAFFVVFTGMSQTSTLYSVSPFNNDLTIIDSNTFVSTTISLSSSVGSVDGCNGLVDLKYSGVHSPCNPPIC